MIKHYSSVGTKGQFVSELPDGGISPMSIASKVLVANLNVEYLNGYKDYTRKSQPEVVAGAWTFTNAPTITNASTSPTAAARYDQITALSGSYVPLTRTVAVNGTSGRITSSAGAQALSANISVTLDLATTGVSANTYKSVTVDVYGRITAGTNPTTVAGYGITDVLAQLLAGYTVGSNTALSSSNSILTAFRNVQGQLNAIPAAYFPTTEFVSDFNAPTGSKILISSSNSPTNAPESEWVNGIQGIYGGNSGYQSQILISMNNNLYSRTKVGGTWGAYVSYTKVLSSNDMNAFAGTGMIRTSSSSPSNGPSSAWLQGFQFNAANASGYNNQLIFAHDTGALYKRTQFAGSWGSYEEIADKPWTIANYTPLTRTITAGTGLSGGGNFSLDRTLSVVYGIAGGTAAEGNDSRINNGQTAYSWGDYKTRNISVYSSTGTLSTTGGTQSLAGDRTWSVDLPTTGISPGSYTKVTVDAYGRSTGGSNPTTLAGYGITDAAALSHTHTASQVTDFTTAGRGLISGTGTISYNSSTGVISYTGGAGSGTIGGTITNPYIPICVSSNTLADSSIYQISGGLFVSNLLVGRNLSLNGGGGYDAFLYVGVNSKHASAIIQSDSTTQGSLIPNMTCAQKTAIASPAISLEVYQTDLGTTAAGSSGYGSSTTGAGFYYFTGLGWVKKAFI